MDKVRKEIILREIQYWKDHRLLPEHYCNFLLSLYTEGSASEQKRYEKSSLWKTIFYPLFNVFVPLQLLMTIVVIYFTEWHIVLQMILFTIFEIITLRTLYTMENSPKKNSYYYHIVLITCILIFFFATVHFISTLFPEMQVPLLSTIILNCLLWFWIGYKKKKNYLIISSMIGILLSILYINL